jgi:Asp-tRNA(Asn)/Glu-tRNA(Gln) amidotransferase A subunit family amidase
MQARAFRLGVFRTCDLPDPKHPLPKFSPPRRVPHGVTLIGKLFDEGMLGRVGVALERAFNVASERPKGPGRPPAQLCFEADEPP